MNRNKAEPTTRAPIWNMNTCLFTYSYPKNGRNVLLSHFHCMIGRKSLDLNWDDQKSEDVVDNDPNVVKSMKALQAYVLCLSK